MTQVTSDVKGGKVFVNNILVSVPQKFKKHVKSIHVFPFHMRPTKGRYGQTMTKLGCVIYLFFDVKDKKLMKRSLLHEIGHVIFEKITKRSVRKKVDELYNSVEDDIREKSRGKLPSYFFSNEFKRGDDEYFASSFAEFILNKENLKKYDPEMYKIINQLG